MATDVPIRCSCGTVTGVVQGLTPSRCNHVVCYCDDCRAFARFLGRADDVLDAAGGTDLVHTSQARLQLHTGLDRLQAIRLSPKGLLRWYAGCCNTPVGSTMSRAKPAFLGMVSACIDRSAGVDVDAAVGPVRSRVHGRLATGEPPPGTHPKIPLSIIPRFAALIAGLVLRRDHRRSPLYDHASGRPIVRPRVLTASERDALRD